MLPIIVIVFVLCYLAIAAEHPLRVSKSASALIGAAYCGPIYAFGLGDVHALTEQLGESVTVTARIVFFLMGAMTIVEVVDAHNGFELITSRIRTTSLSSLMWLIGLVTFVLSAILDNLTTAIVMVSLLRKLLDKHEDRLFFAGIVVIAANSGGAWSPIGDVTTTMLWIGGQVTTVGIIEALWLPSLVSLLVPLTVTAYLLRGRQRRTAGRKALDDVGNRTPPFERNLMFFLGLGILVAVPAFKSITHLPPFMGILLGLGVLWLVGDLLHRRQGRSRTRSA